MKPGTISIVLLLPVIAMGQATAPQPPAAASPVPYASVSELNLLLSQAEQSSQAIQADLSRLRIERWKTDSGTKRDTQADVESMQRNLQNALPEIIAQLRSAPESLSTTFKLYRNLDALYEVFASVVESAGAFGSKDEYQFLQNDLSQLQRTRRSLADRTESLSNSKEQELTNLRTQLHDLQTASAAPPPQPKKVVVDDSAPPKPAKKAIKKKPAATPSQTPSTAPAAQPAPPQPQQN